VEKIQRCFPRIPGKFSTLINRRRPPFLLADALFFKGREGGRAVSRAALVVSGVRSDGYREILGVRIGDTESFATWDETFRRLKGRGLQGVMFVVSDSHSGLAEAIAKNFQGASRQRCQVHLMRSLLGHTSTRHRAEVAAAAKLAFQAQDVAEARRRLAEFAGRFGETAPQAVKCPEEGFGDAMAIVALPEKYRKRLRTTDMQERLNEEIRRRGRVIQRRPGVAPDGRSPGRAKRSLAGAPLPRHGRIQRVGQRPQGRERGKQ